MVRPARSASAAPAVGQSAANPSLDLYHCSICCAYVALAPGYVAIHGRPVHCGMHMDPDSTEEARLLADLEPGVVYAIDGAPEPRSADADWWDGLSWRERQVARLLALDLSYKEIAARLHISVSTIKDHQAAVYRCLNVERKMDLARKLIRIGALTMAEWMAKALEK